VPDNSIIVASPLTNFLSLAVKCEADVPFPVGSKVAILAYSPPYYWSTSK